MAKKPWYTSDDLITSIKRNISVPISQNTFTEDDILSFINEEMQVSMVPDVLSFHEEFFVVTKEVPLVANQPNYPIPDRAIGMKLRDLFYKSNSGDLVQMVRINQEDRGLYQQSNGSYYDKFFMQNNDVVLPTAPGAGTSLGSLFFVYFIRPNQLVPNDQVAVSESFYKEITIDNTTLVAGNTLTINTVVYEAVASSPTGNQFLIGVDSNSTATNLNSVLLTSGVSSTVNTSIVTVRYLNLDNSFSTTNSVAISFSSNISIEFESVPTTIINGSIVDFLELNGGHKIKGMSVELGSNSINLNVISFNPSDIPSDFIIGDYIALEHECMIPMLPNDIHIMLAEKAANRILASLGDTQGQASSQQRIAEMRLSQTSLINNRVEGAPLKVVNRNAMLRYTKSTPFRKLF